MMYFLAALTVLIIVLGIVPLLVRGANRIGFVDRPTERKKHKAPMPLVGGVAMFIGFAIGFSLFIGYGKPEYTAIIMGGCLILCIGILDDWYKTKQKEFAIFPRVLIQFAAAALVYAAGIRFTGFMNPFTDSYVWFPPLLQFALTILWIFGLTTVINFSDGLDGLAGGLSAISAGTLFVAALFMGQADSAFMAIVLIGAILGFMRYNMFPAKIFMGDSGANLLGFMLAVISLHGAFKQATLVSLFVPVLALGVPIFDNIFVVVKRFIERKPIYKADLSQIHYRLLKTGLNPLQAVLFIFLISACLNLTSIILLLLKL